MRRCVNRFASHFLLLKGSNVPFCKFTVTSRKFVIFKLIFMGILNPSCFNAFVIFSCICLVWYHSVLLWLQVRHIWIILRFLGLLFEIVAKLWEFRLFIYLCLVIPSYGQREELVIVLFFYPWFVVVKNNRIYGSTLLFWIPRLKFAYTGLLIP